MTAATSLIGLSLKMHIVLTFSVIFLVVALNDSLVNKYRSELQMCKYFKLKDN